MKVKCPKCNHEWETKSKLCQVRCASCGRLINIRDKISEGKK